MGIKNFFSRCKCDSPKLRKLITNWTQNEGWTFNDFQTFLELVGIFKPTYLSELTTDKENSFNCKTADNKEFTITLLFGDGWDSCSELCVTDGIETKTYECNSKSEHYPHPKVVYTSRNIVKESKSLNSYYSEYFCHRTLKIDDTHTLSIEFDEPNKYKDDKSNICVLANAYSIEEYLFSLDNSVSVSEVYEKVVSMLCMTAEDIMNSEKILVSYIEGNDKSKQELAKILVLNGKIQEYATRDGDEIFHLFKNHSWQYTYNGIRIIYTPEKDEYFFSINGTNAIINALNPKDILHQVNEKVSKMWIFFN